MPRPETSLAEALKLYIMQEAARAGLFVDHVSAPESTRANQKPEAQKHPIDIVVVGLHPIIVLDLGENINDARVAWAAGQRHAAIARTTVAADKGEDLILVLVGPPGSRENGEWNALAMEIERNDLVCRKLVWLPREKKPLAPESLQEFLRRTLIKKPWLSTEPSQPQALDRLVTQDLGLRGWQKILDEQPLNRDAVDYDELVKSLIDAEQP